MYPLVPGRGVMGEEDEEVKILKDRGLKAGVARLLVRWEALALAEERVDWDVVTVSFAIHRLEYILIDPSPCSALIQLSWAKWQGWPWWLDFQRRPPPSSPWQ